MFLWTKIENKIANGTAQNKQSPVNKEKQLKLP